MMPFLFTVRSKIPNASFSSSLPIALSVTEAEDFLSTPGIERDSISNAS